MAYFWEAVYSFPQDLPWVDSCKLGISAESHRLVNGDYHEKPNPPVLHRDHHHFCLPHCWGSIGGKARTLAVRRSGRLQAPKRNGDSRFPLRVSHAGEFECESVQCCSVADLSRREDRRLAVACWTQERRGHGQVLCHF